MSKQTLKIDDKVYKYLSFNGFGEYLVIAVKELKNSFLYEVECQSCTDHDKCTLYIAEHETDKGVYKFVVMTNNLDIDDIPQHGWHNDRLFHSNINDAKVYEYEKCVSLKQDEINKRAETLTRLNKELLELKEHLANIKEVINKEEV